MGSIPAHCSLLLVLALTQGVAHAEVIKSTKSRETRYEVRYPDNYDPQPGPFIVRLNDGGQVAEEQYDVIATAVRAWSGSNLQVFEICFRSQHGPVDWGTSFKALKAVARELKVRDAKVVVMPPGGLCHPSSRRPEWQGSYVEIMGVVRF